MSEATCDPAGGRNGLVSRIAVLGLVAALACPAVLTAQATDPVFTEFQARVANYVAVRARAREGNLVPPDRQPGAIFSAPLAALLRDRLHRILDETEVGILLMELYPDGLPPAGAPLTCPVNSAAILPPGVVAALPPVPPPLAYRLAGLHLALWDEEASIVVDVVADALLMPRIWPVLQPGATEIRARVRQAIRDAGLDALELVDEMIEDTIEGAEPPVVGKPFSWELGTKMPPSVLRILPELPPPLEYRLALSDLVDIDIQRNIVVGIVHHVLPRRSLSPHARWLDDPGVFQDRRGGTQHASRRSETLSKARLQW